MADEEARSRIVQGEDPDRFYCPAPGCSRSFAELWRLKVHFRAPPDVRGSGKERGHGTELKFCPKCGKELKPGKHHVGCAAGKSAPRQAAKRRRNVSSSEEDPESANQSSHSSSWQRLVDSAVQRRRTRTRGPKGEKDDAHVGSEEVLVSNLVQQRGPCKVEAMEDIRVSTDLLGHGATALDSDLLPNLMDTAEGRIADGDSALAGDLRELERLPSPPPLPLDWEIGGETGVGQGFLFDFGQFEPSSKGARRQSSLPQLDERTSPGIGPHTTAVSAMNPVNISTPSDDYIWQILFANPTDEVPKRVTAHMHNPATHSAALDTLPDVSAYDPVYSTIFPCTRGQELPQVGGDGIAGDAVPGTGGEGAGTAAKKKVTVTYEVGEDGKWNPTDVRHDEDKGPTGK